MTRFIRGLVEPLRLRLFLKNVERDKNMLGIGQPIQIRLRSDLFDGIALSPRTLPVCTYYQPGFKSWGPSPICATFSGVTKKNVVSVDNE